MRQNVTLRPMRQVVLLLFKISLVTQNVRNSLSQTHAECIRVDSNPAESTPCYSGSARNWYGRNVAEGFWKRPSLALISAFNDGACADPGSAKCVGMGCRFTNRLN